MAPLIGITATLKEDPETVADRPLGSYVRADIDYVEGVERAGGAPVILAPVGGASLADSIVEGLDGLLLSGGSDIGPKYYGEDPIPELSIVIPERDEFEIALASRALERGIPIFGICRGLQLLNVVLGGTLYQDLPTQRGPEFDVHRQTTPKWQPTHEVEPLSGSFLASILGGDHLKVNSYHHQAVKDLAAELVVSAYSADGLVEAVESPDLAECWAFGVQWHAEAMREAYPEQRRLFEALVAAATRHALRRAAA